MLVGISGKIGSGKDTVGKIMQIIIDNPQLNTAGVMVFLKEDVINPSWKIKKFADKLKDIVCMLINCTREQLEDQSFKEKELGEEWWYYKIPSPQHANLVSYLDNDFSQEDKNICNSRYLIKMTPRLLLQLLGTECGRNIIHPNIWVNALMSEYVDKHELSTWGHEPLFPNWIITDTRFPNEMQAVISRDGITIRVNREIHGILENGTPFQIERDSSLVKEHESETALDGADFNYSIYNNGTIEELIESVRQILIEEKII